MDFQLTAAQRALHDEILAGAREMTGSRGHDHFSPVEWKAAAGLGLTGLCLSREHGGLGLGALDTALCLEASGRGCGDTGLLFGVAAHLLACAVPVRDFCSGQHRATLLSGLAGGDLIAANAMTEDEAGSDVSRLRTTASRIGDHYVLDGEKSFASNAPVAGLIVTYAVTDASAGFLGISAFAVPRGLPGIEVSEPLAKMGLQGCPAGRVRFTACEVPLSWRIGAEGQGSLIFQHSMAWERACLPAIYLGVMDEQLRRCVDHARQRRQFGRRIGDNQGVSHTLAAMAQRLASARLLLYRACWLLDQGGQDHRAAGAMAKIAVSEAAVANSVDAIQIFGGAGYLTATGIEEQLRDAVPGTIFSGTTQIQREIIARELGL
jgi:L-prolyl-[peptidyl-carrier protein] dehydrogenase